MAAGERDSELMMAVDWILIDDQIVCLSIRVLSLWMRFFLFINGVRGTSQTCPISAYRQIIWGFSIIFIVQFHSIPH